MGTTDEHRLTLMRKGKALGLGAVGDRGLTELGGSGGKALTQVVQRNKEGTEDHLRRERNAHYEVGRSSWLSCQLRWCGCCGLRYCVADFSPRRRMRSCSFLRRAAGALGLKATRYQSGWERSRLRRESVDASLFGWRAIFSRIAEYGWCERRPRVLAVTFGCSLIRRSR